MRARGKGGWSASTRQGGLERERRTRVVLRAGGEDDGGEKMEVDAGAGEGAGVKEDLKDDEGGKDARRSVRGGAKAAAEEVGKKRVRKPTEKVRDEPVRG